MTDQRRNLNGRGLETYWINGEGISEAVIKRLLPQMLGKDAGMVPGSYRGVPGYRIRAVRPFTGGEMDGLKEMTAEYKKEISQLHLSRDHHVVSQKGNGLNKNFFREEVWLYAPYRQTFANGEKRSLHTALLDTGNDFGNLVSSDLVRKLGMEAHMRMLKEPSMMSGFGGGLTQATHTISLIFKLFDRGEKTHSADFFVEAPSDFKYDMIWGSNFIIEHELLSKNLKRILTIVPHQQTTQAENAEMSERNRDQYQRKNFSDAWRQSYQEQQQEQNQHSKDPLGYYGSNAQESAIPGGQLYNAQGSQAGYPYAQENHFPGGQAYNTPGSQVGYPYAQENHFPGGQAYNTPGSQVGYPSGPPPSSGYAAYQQPIVNGNPGYEQSNYGAQHYTSQSGYHPQYGGQEYAAPYTSREYPEGGQKANQPSSSSKDAAKQSKHGSSKDSDHKSSKR